MKSVLLIAGHKNITTLTSEGLRSWRSVPTLRKSTGATDERDWVWNSLIPALREKLIASGVQVFITDAIYHSETYARDYDLCLALHFDAGGTDSRCIISKPRPNQNPTYIFPEASVKADEFINHWLGVYPEMTGITSRQDRITEGMTDYYAWDYVKEGTPSVIIEHGNNTCKADHEKMFSQVERIAEADCEAVRRFFGIKTQAEPEKPSEPTTPAQTQDLGEVMSRLIKLESGVQQTADELSNVKRRLDDHQKSLDLLNDDRGILETIQSKLTGFEEAVKLNTQSNTTLSNRLTTEIRALTDATDNKYAEIERRIRVIEDRPVSSDEHIKIVRTLPFGLFIGRIK